MLDENPADVAARLRLARLHRDGGVPTRASDQLRQVLQADPQNRGALAMLAELGGGEKGLLRKLRGR